MKEFAYQKAIDKNTSEKIIRRLIYNFFRGNIRKNKVRIRGELKNKTYFSFKRPFSSNDSILSYPQELYNLFPEDELYVLRHYSYNNNTLPLFLAPSKKIKEDLENLELITNYEYSYIFDKNFSYCFFVTDSYIQKSENVNYIAILQLYKPIINDF